MTTEVLEVAPVMARPWRTIWFSPRRTMRELLASEVRPGWTLVVGLAALHGALATLGGLAAKGELSFTMAAMPTIIGVLQVVFGVLSGHSSSRSAAAGSAARRTRRRSVSHSPGAMRRLR